jgi:hypothetical protein
MNHYILYAYISFGIIATLISLWYLYKDVTRVHKDLDALKNRAQFAENEQELEDVQVSLLLYAAKNCWHKNLTSHAREVLNYIHGCL